MRQSRSQQLPRTNAKIDRKRTGSFPVLFLFAIAFATCLVGVAACGSGDNEPSNTPTNADTPEIPVSWDDQSDRDWLHRSQFKTHMRHMWVDSNRIVSAGRGDMEPTWEEISAAAGDIQWRAELMGKFWSSIDGHIQEALFCVDDEDRIGVTSELTAMSNDCDSCHMASWSPAYLHVTGSIVDGWLKNLPSEHDVNEVDPNPPPLIKNRDSMQQLWHNLRMAKLRLRNWQVEDLQEELSEMAPLVATRVKRWKDVAEQAARIVELASSRQADGMKAAYTQMTDTCLRCHAELVGTREILVPMPWDGPVE